MVYPYFLRKHKDFLIILIMWDSVSQKNGRPQQAWYKRGSIYMEFCE